jgi:hypothetical protein
MRNKELFWLLWLLLDCCDCCLRCGATLFNTRQRCLSYQTTTRLRFTLTCTSASLIASINAPEKRQVLPMHLQPVCRVHLFRLYRAHSVKWVRNCAPFDFSEMIRDDMAPRWEQNTNICKQWQLVSLALAIKS